MARRQLRQSKKKPLIVICSEGGKKSSEYYYFRNHTNRDLRIQFSTGNSTDPKGMLDDLLKYIRNEDIVSEDNCRIFLVLDTDLDERRISEIKEIEQECIDNNIEIVTSAPTFEIWYLMHYRNNRLKFQTSKDVKRELQNLNGTYTESMDMYKIIKDSTDNARSTAQSLEQQIIRNKEDLLSSNPHTSIYKILDVIDEFNNLNN
ncbi:MAG TPA: RloB domain-containing protein [Candidatus Pelethosoma merdigallinarum]|nr:RloB domain-containing protein [Candidatus Pelethosoma merdigallinarum]